MLSSFLSIEAKKYLCPHKKSFIAVFIAALFIIAKKWKQPQCSLFDEWISKICYFHTVEYYMTMKRNEVLMNAKTWAKLKNSIPSERNQ